MGIKVQHGKVEDVAKLGILAGKSEAAAEAMQRQLLQIEHDKQMLQFRAELDLEAAKRSQQWEVEKMEIRSRTDFAREEGRRQQKLAEKQSKLDALERAYNSGIISEEDYHNAYVQTASDVPFYTYAKRAELEGAKKDPIKQYIAQMMAGEEGGATPSPTPAATGRVRVVSPQGQSGTIEAAEWPTYQAQGFRKI
jgi:hypothetical protein